MRYFILTAIRLMIVLNAYTLLSGCISRTQTVQSGSIKSIFPNDFGHFNGQANKLAASDAKISDTELRELLASKMINDPNISGPLLLGPRLLVDATIHGPTPHKNWLTGVEGELYCVQLTSKEFSYGLDKTQGAYYVILNKKGRFMAYPLEARPKCDNGSQKPFPEIEKLSIENQNSAIKS